MTEIGAGRTVSCCVAEAKPAAETVSVGGAGLTILVLETDAGRSFGNRDVRSRECNAVGAKEPAPVDELDSVTVTPPLPAATGLPSKSSS